MTIFRNCFAILILAALVPLPSAAAHAAVVNRIAAVVDDEVITLYEVEQSAQPFVDAFLNSEEGRALSDVDRRKRVSELKKKVMQEIVEQKLLEAEVKRLGIPVNDHEVDEYIERIKKANRLSNEQLASSLSSEGKSMEDFRDDVKNQILREQYVSFRLKNKVDITEDDTRSYYTQHMEDFVTERVIALSEIRLPLLPDASAEQADEARAKAASIYEQVVTGADFAETAKKHSSGPTASAGGSLGSWKVDTELAPSYRKYARDLKPAEISPPYRDEKGFVILRCDAWDRSGYLPYEEVADKIKMLLQKETAEREMKKLAKELYKKSFVDVKVQEF